MVVRSITQTDRLENVLIVSQFESSILNILLLGTIYSIYVKIFLTN